MKHSMEKMLILVHWIYKVRLKQYFNIDIPNLQSLTSEGSSFVNPRTITLKSIVVTIYIHSRYCELILSKKLHRKLYQVVFHSFASTIRYSKIFGGVYQFYSKFRLIIRNTILCFSTIKDYAFCFKVSF